MVELGINLEDQENSEEFKSADNENSNLEDIKTSLKDESDKTELENVKDEEDDQSIESIPFISEPVKKKRTRVSK